MKTVWKFPVRVDDEIVIDMPHGAEILCVQKQAAVRSDVGVFELWATVDPGEAPEPRRLSIRGTGHPLGVVGRYIGTVQDQGGALVWHVFES